MRAPLTLEQFREEVADKLSVVFHGCHGLPLQRAVTRNQCEEFLVERYAEALEAWLPSRLIALRDQWRAEICGYEINGHGPPFASPDDIHYECNDCVILDDLRTRADALDGLLTALPHPQAAEKAAEVCICAAIRTGEGEIVRGHRHDDAISTAMRMNLTPSSLAGTQGFMTSRNRYVDREEGARLQRAAGVLSAWTGKPVTTMLFSEDLYLKGGGR